MATHSNKIVTPTRLPSPAESHTIDRHPPYHESQMDTCDDFDHQLTTIDRHSLTTVSHHSVTPHPIILGDLEDLKTREEKSVEMGSEGDGTWFSLLLGLEHALHEGVVGALDPRPQLHNLPLQLLSSVWHIQHAFGAPSVSSVSSVCGVGCFVDVYLAFRVEVLGFRV
jgi:hypothetical protein